MTIFNERMNEKQVKFTNGFLMSASVFHVSVKKSYAFMHIEINGDTYWFVKTVFLMAIYYIFFSNCV